MTRHGPGEGNVYRRRDGRWCARLQLGYAGGKRLRKHYYARTRREVVEKLDRAKADLRRGIAPGNDRLTIGDYLEQWLQEVATPSVRPSTLAAYEMHCRLHLIPELGSTSLSKLTPQAVQAMLNRKLASGLSPRSVKHLHAVLRGALNMAVRWDLVARNVALLVDPPRVPRRDVPVLSPEEARRFLAVVGDDRLGPLYSLTLAVGLRQGEALGLRWEDLDLDLGTLTVRRALQRVGGQLTYVEPKSSTSRRTIPLPPTTVADLRAHRRRQIAERLQAGGRWRDHGLVFTSTIGTPCDGTAVTRHLHELLAAAGLPRLRFHDLRHASASLMLSQGVHPRLVADMLGHSQTSLTLNTYGHVIPSLRREAADRMEEVLGRRPVNSAGRR